jgi:hypothetical protein
LNTGEKVTARNEDEDEDEEKDEEAEGMMSRREGLEEGDDDFGGDEEGETDAKDPSSFRLV